MISMKISNIDINELIELLVNMRNDDNVMIDIEVSKNEERDRIIIHPVKIIENFEDVLNTSDIQNLENMYDIQDPEINSDENTIYGMFKNIS